MSGRTIASLFAGIEGLGLGLERAGVGEVVVQVEIDPFCRAVLEKNYPNARRYADVREVRGHHLVDHDGRPVDVIAGGFPCQDLSCANHAGRGLEGPRSGLWFEFRRLVEEARPVGVVVENVGRLVGRGLDVVAAGLHDLGYAVEFARIRASDVGAPHRRDRVFLVGVLAHADRRRRSQLGVEEHAGLGSAPGDVADGRGAGGRRDRQVAVLGSGWRADLALADAGLGGQPQRGTGAEAGGRGEPAGGGRGPAEPGVGRGVDGLPPGLHGPGPGGEWPAPRGAPQRAWEAPRTGRVRDSGKRRKALGNAVLPQVAYIVGRRLVERLEGP